MKKLFCVVLLSFASIQGCHLVGLCKKPPERLGDAGLLRCESKGSAMACVYAHAEGEEVCFEHIKRSTCFREWEQVEKACDEFKPDHVNVLVP